jgi:hypothetical protein
VDRHTGLFCREREKERERERERERKRERERERERERLTDYRTAALSLNYFELNYA